MRLTAAGFTLLAYGTICSASTRSQVDRLRAGHSADLGRRGDRDARGLVRSASCARRLCADWRPYGRQTFASKGHQYGLTLPDPDRRALIAFLKTL